MEGVHAVTVMLIDELFIIGFVVVESVESKLNSSSKFICLRIHIEILELETMARIIRIGLIKGRGRWTLLSCLLF